MSVPDRSGQQVGPYRLQSVLAEGSMAVVYRALDTRTDETIALKTLHPRLEGQDTFPRRFMREAKVARLLQNPNTVRVLDFGEAEDGTLYIVMELLTGRTLRQLLDEHGPLSVPVAADIGVQICRSLEEAHRNGIVHRDLKPENVFVCQDDDGGPLVRVLDYGVARIDADVRRDSAEHTVLTASSLTASGHVLGTPTYMSPEQSSGGEVDGRSDLYSLGVLLYELVAGRPPFEDLNSLRLLARHRHEPAPPIESERTVPPALASLTRRLLRKDPDDRPPSAMAVLEVLLDLLESSGEESALVDARTDDTEITAPRAGRLQRLLRGKAPAVFVERTQWPDDETTHPYDRPVAVTMDLAETATVFDVEPRFPQTGNDDDDDTA